MFQRLIVIVLIIALINAIPVWSRQHDDLEWKAHVCSCVNFETYNVPVHHDGSNSKAWYINLSGKRCNELLEHDLFLSRWDVENIPTFTYSVQMMNVNESPYENYLKNDGLTLDNQSIKLHRGDKVLFSSGLDEKKKLMSIYGYDSDFRKDLPIIDNWVVLDFSSERLPPEFTLNIKAKNLIDNI